MHLQRQNNLAVRSRVAFELGPSRFMAVVQAGELLCELENVFLSYFWLNTRGAWRARSLVLRALLGHFSEGSHCCWRARGKAEDSDNAPCQGKDLSTSHVRPMVKHKTHLNQQTQLITFQLHDHLEVRGNSLPPILL